MPPRPTVMTPDRIEKIIACLEGGGGLHTAAKRVGISRQTIWEHTKRNAEFKARVDAATNKADEHVVSALYESAMSGNVTAMIFWLKNRQRGIWRDRHDIEVTTRQDGLYVAQFSDGRTIQQQATDIPAATVTELPN